MTARGSSSKSQYSFLVAGANRAGVCVTAYSRMEIERCCDHSIGGTVKVRERGSKPLEDVKT
jgi:hypothetical protein